MTSKKYPLSSLQFNVSVRVPNQFSKIRKRNNDKYKTEKEKPNKYNVQGSWIGETEKGGQIKTKEIRINYGLVIH